jgi:hypothetical protein
MALSLPGSENEKKRIEFRTTLVARHFVAVGRLIPLMKSARAFHLSDPMVLVAVSALALGLFKAYHAAMSPLYWCPTIVPATRFTGWVNGLWGSLIRAFPIVMTWTLAILVLRFRRPLPRSARIVRQPGFVAALVALLALVWRSIGFATLYWRVGRDPGLGAWQPRHFQGLGCFVGGNPGWMLLDMDHFLNTMAMIGAAVAASWLLLFVSGQWRPERSWIDRLGRVIGWYWIAIMPLTSWWDFHARF